MSDPVYHSARSASEAFRGYIALALPTLVEVIQAKQPVADAERPTLPYATVERTRQRDLALPYRRVGDVLAEPEGDEDERTHELELSRMREITVEVAVYGDTGPDLVELIATSRGRVPEQDYLHTNGIAFRAVSDVLDTRELRDTAWEPSALQEFAVIYALQDLSSVGTIETVYTLGYGPFDATYTP